MVNSSKSFKRLSIKDIRSQVGRVCLVRTKVEGCSSDADVCTSWCQKLWIFRNLRCIQTGNGGGGLKQCGILRSIFCDCVGSFTDGHLRPCLPCQNCSKF